MSVIWKKVPDWPEYEVSTDGRIRSIVRRKGSKNRELRGSITYQPNGRPMRVQVSLCRNGKRANLRLHRLILVTFVGQPPAGTEACHFDGNPLNNSLENLRWDTRRANQHDSIRHGTKVGPPVLYQGMSRRHRSRQCQATP